MDQGLPDRGEFRWRHAWRSRTWQAWDGRPIARFDDDGAPGRWTPYKALRRITDYRLDHLHEVEALLAGVEPVPDTWRGRVVTPDADWAGLAEAGYDEACSRLRRLGHLYVLRRAAAAAGRGTRRGPRHGHCRRSPGHVTNVTWYAEQVGGLA